MRFIWLAPLLLLVGCSGSDMNDLQQFVDEVKARPPGTIAPVPEPAEVDTYLYVGGDRRDPFIADGRPEEPEETVVESGISPDFERQREELEQHSLDSLRMVGTLDQETSTWGLVQSVDGTIHRVQVGNHMGRNFGKIVEISEDRIRLVELVQIGSGYQEQEAALSLGGGGN